MNPSREHDKKLGRRQSGRSDWRLLACALILVNVGCGGSPQSSAPAPMVITSVSPLPTVNNSAFTMQVTGSGFLQGAMVMEAGGIFFPTTFIDSGHVSAAVPANAFTTSRATIYVYLDKPPNCMNQYCNLGYWSNAYDIQVQPGP
jgi:hypothetical protein